MRLLFQIVVVALVGYLQMLLGGLIVKLVFRVADQRAANQTGSEGSGLIRAAGSQLRGGAWIGALERIAVYATLLAGFPEGIAIVLGIKGLARYPELQAPSTGAAERFIIGTFTSVLIAAGAAGLAHVLLSLD